MEGRRRGEIAVTCIVYCGRCDTDPMICQRARNKHQAVIEARVNGWKYTSRDGWICSDCVDEQRRCKGA